MMDAPPMRDELPHDAGIQAHNVGTLDAALRGIGAFLVPLTVGTLVAVWHADWVFSLVIHGLILTAYLALSAIARIDPFYELAGVSTIRRATRRRRGSGRAAT